MSTTRYYVVKYPKSKLRPNKTANYQVDADHTMLFHTFMDLQVKSVKQESTALLFLQLQFIVEEL